MLRSATRRSRSTGTCCTTQHGARAGDGGAQAGPDAFRTAPLRGRGQRFFLHDGRTTGRVEAIEAHRSGPGRRFRGSDANRVVTAFDPLDEAEPQDLLSFLRSL
jgi:CxxC motif-containing protein (DUF1111 family)